MGLPEGDYPGKIVPQIGADGSELMIKFGRSQQKGTPQADVMLEVTSGPHIGEQIKWTGYLSGGAVDNCLKALRRMGFEGDDLDRFNDQQPTAEFTFAVADEEYKGKFYTKVKWINTSAPVFTAADLALLSAEVKPKLAQFTVDEASVLPDPDDDVAF